MRDDPALKRGDPAALKAASSQSVQAGAVFNEGDVLHPKIDNVKMMAEPSATATSVATLRKTEELVYLGHEKEGSFTCRARPPEGGLRRRW